MSHETLTAISPLDGRYSNTTKKLAQFVSEKGLIHYRTKVECSWLIHLMKQGVVPSVTNEDITELQTLFSKLLNHDDTFISNVKSIETRVRHDVKSVEMALGDYLTEHNLQQYIPYLHFAMTSEDVNNLAWGLMLTEARAKVLIPAMKNVMQSIIDIAAPHLSLAMLARTHGQPASPTTLGKELAVFLARFTDAIQQWSKLQLPGKCNGATGNFNAHCIAYPDLDWQSISNEFIISLGLRPNPITTQIESNDYLAKYCDLLAGINSIGIDFSRDIWSYISMGYFAQKTIKDEVGSSTMPHKINPIDFENAEGNFIISRSCARTLADNLTISRLQRDLSGSTVIRNMPVILGHTLVSFDRLENGLKRLSVNSQRITSDLEGKWELLSEAFQTVLRLYGDSNSYQNMKDSTRGQSVNQTNWLNWIDSNKELSELHRTQLTALTPQTYTGKADAIGKTVLDQCQQILNTW